MANNDIQIHQKEHQTRCYRGAAMPTGPTPYWSTLQYSTNNVNHYAVQRPIGQQNVARG